MSRILKAGLAYAAIVFAAGFVLGTVRVLLVVPALGRRWAELLELPLMLIAAFIVARFITRRWAPLSPAQRLAVGGLSLALMLGAELGLVLAQGMTIPAYMASRDPVSGTAYLLSLLGFAAFPSLVNRASGADRQPSSDTRG